MGVLMAETAERGTTIVMSSHILTELEGACDYLLFVDGGRVRLGGEAEDIVDAHALLTGRARDLAPHTVIESRTTGRQLTALVRKEGPVDTAAWAVTQPSLEELLLAHLRSPDAPPLLTPSASAGVRGGGFGVSTLANVRTLRGRPACCCAYTGGPCGSPGPSQPPRSSA